MLLEINGTLKLSFFELNGIAPVTEERKQDIETKLSTGDFIIGLASGDVLSLPNLQVEAKFKFEVLDDTEYNFVEDTEED